ncbi:Uu.00g080860.m01.CDS01 [Anthostomella pinea]|uniref:Uu.00g080860.m01.CDS01 n=1 Tax=Anthostomella pinea TaxID=933095 RepID=A0AAI8YJC7_9PEZI|nr:Uu.00g080860.m01.CDS01 [Anthostomella pinea]
MSDSHHIRHLVDTVLDNLQYQHDWTQLQVLTHSPVDGSPLPRPLISGLPLRRLYLHPDDQLEMLKAHPKPEDRLPETPEIEWVLPTHLAEKWSLKSFASVFDSMPAQAPSRPERPKRILLATIHDDSTIVYYFMHDGLVKPRQN